MEQGNSRRDIPFNRLTRPYLRAVFVPNTPRSDQNSILANKAISTDNNLGISVGQDISWTVTQEGLYSIAVEARWTIAIGDGAQLGLGWTRGSVSFNNLIGYQTHYRPSKSAPFHEVLDFSASDWFYVGEVITFVGITRNAVTWISSGNNSYVDIRMII